MPRDVAAETATGTKSVRNSLTVTMHVTGVGTVEAATGAQFLQTSGVIATRIALSAGVGVVITGIGTTPATGVVTDRSGPLT
jgi:hypothetical protein